MKLTEQGYRYNYFNYIHLIEIPTAQVQSRFYFGLQPELNGKKIFNIEVVKNEVSTIKSPLARNIVNENLLNSSLLTLSSKDNKEIVKSLPLNSLSWFNNSVQTVPVPLRINQEISWEKSYIDIQDVSNINTAESYCLLIFCQDKQLIPSIENKIELTEVSINTADERYFVPQNLNIKNRPIYGLFLAFGKTTPTGKSSAGLVDVYSSYLTVFDKSGKEILHNLPMRRLCDLSDFDKNFVFDYKIRLSPFLIDFENSFIINKATSPTNGRSYLIYYLYK